MNDEERAAQTERIETLERALVKKAEFDVCVHYRILRLEAKVLYLQLQVGALCFALVVVVMALRGIF